MKVWLVMEEEVYGIYHPLGICSTEERADIVVEAKKRELYNDVVKKEFEVNRLYEDIKSELQIEHIDAIKSANECLELLERMKTTELLES